MDVYEALKELAEYTAMKKELDVQINNLESKVKDYLINNHLDEILGRNGEHATYRIVISKRFQSTDFKKEHADLYSAFTKNCETMRFTFNA